MIVGTGEKLSEVFIGPWIGGGIEIWFGYVLVLFVLLVRPEGLFGEKIAEAYLGPYIGGGIEYWFAYVLALAVLLVRPQGLFGERIIERI